MSIDIDKLTPEEKAALMQTLEAERLAEQQQKEQERLRYKQLQEETVEEVFAELEKASANLALLKRKAFDTLNTLVAMKKEIYHTTKDNKSHTFTNSVGDKSITIGSQERASWDGTQKEGIELIDTYLTEKVIDPEMKAFIDELLKRDKNDQLDIKRAMSLASLKEKITDSRFREGVDILLAAYKVTHTAIYVEARERKGDDRKWKGIPLSFASVEAAEVK